MQRALPSFVSTSARIHRCRWFGQALLVVLALVLPARLARCDVSVFGDVLPIDNPFTTDDNEGLPGGDGNFLSNTAGLGDNTQITFEGWINFDFLNAENDTNVNADVLIGTRSFGLVQIGAPTELRFMNLVVGGTTTDDDDNIFIGNGNLEISGPGALYNNDYTILPSFVVQQGVTEDLISVVPRSSEPGAEEGFDMIIGRDNGIGTVSILAGARAEIHDSIVIGDLGGGIGVLTVDGFGSFLGRGSFEADQADDPLDPHVMVVGRLGTGTLNITNGGQVVSSALTSDTEDSLGAVLGSNPYLTIDTGGGGNQEEPGAGGSGIALVDGLGSRWVVGGGLQIGGFSDSLDEGATIEDFEGNDVVYGSTVGDGILTVQNGGIVHVTNPPEMEEQVTLSTKLVIGRRGILQFNTGGTQPSGSELNAAGRVIVGNPGGAGGGFSGQTEDQVLINDGLIRGSGRIDTGIFRNRHLGQVRVGQGERLLVTAAADVGFDFDDCDADATAGCFPFSNYGLIEVTHGEIEFDRGEDDIEMEPAVFQPFRNRALDVSDPVQLISRRVGLIESYDSVMRFRSNLSNQGIVLFSGGDNEVYGDVVNEGSTVGMPVGEEGTYPGEFPEGLVSIVGNETHVVFKDILTNNGTIDVAPNTLGFTAGEFVMGPTGTLSLVLGGGDTGQDVTHISILDNGFLDGRLEVDLFQTGTTPIDPMLGDEFAIMSAGFGLIGDFSSFGLPFLGDTLGWFPQNLGTSYILEVIGAAPIGVPDLNGDGVIDSEDEAIWLANAGNPGGLGDINGDGIVDGADLLIILGSFGPFPGAGSGSGVNVPEPTSLILLTTMFAALGAGSRCRRC